MLRLTDNEPLFKYEDYYLGSGREHFEYATSVEEALEMGGSILEPACSLESMLSAKGTHVLTKRDPLESST